MSEAQVWFALWLGALYVACYIRKTEAFSEQISDVFVFAGWFFFVYAAGLFLFATINKAEASSTPIEDCHYFYTEKYAKMAGFCYDGLDSWKNKYAYPRHIMWAVPDSRMIFNSEFAIPSYALVECETLFDPFAIGGAGELGQWQILPDNAKEMSSLDLEFGNHRDMATYAVFLWNRSEWKDWGCQKTLD